jgi:hypothetical protein
MVWGRVRQRQPKTFSLSTGAFDGPSRVYFVIVLNACDDDERPQRYSFVLCDSRAVNADSKIEPE